MRKKVKYLNKRVEDLTIENMKFGHTLAELIERIEKLEASQIVKMTDTKFTDFQESAKASKEAGEWLQQQNLRTKIISELNKLQSIYDLDNFIINNSGITPCFTIIFKEKQ